MTAHQAHAGGVGEADWTAKLEAGVWSVVDSNDHEVCWVGCESEPIAQGDAEYIARACNAHGPLVEALERYGRHDWVCGYPTAASDGDPEPVCICGFEAALATARAGTGRGGEG